MFMLLILLPFFIQGVHISTPITSKFKIDLIQGTFMHPWVYDMDRHYDVSKHNDQAFVDWENNQVRKFIAYNESIISLNFIYRSLYC